MTDKLFLSIQNIDKQEINQKSLNTLNTILFYFQKKYPKREAKLGELSLNFLEKRIGLEKYPCCVLKVVIGECHYFRYIPARVQDVGEYFIYEHYFTTDAELRYIFENIKKWVEEKK